jgi:hypothetical protein
MIEIVSQLIPVGLKLLGLWLDNSKADAESKAAFLTFVRALNSSGIIQVSVRLRSQLEQEQQIKDQWNKK